MALFYMTDHPLDIIIPVWNSPVEVRAALASFAADAPLARLVMVNNGSERETEAILHEFAEALDSRALLLSTGRNIGTVAALNLGLSRSTAALVMVTNPYVKMTSGWLDPVLTVFDQTIAAGAVCLRSKPGINIEVDSGSFAAMILKRELLLRTAGFDEEMDGALWALRDFVRKATACGYKTLSVCSRQFLVDKPLQLGSQARRLQRATAARQCYIDRWGEPGTYMINCTDSIPGDSIALFRDALLASARQGDRVTVAAASKILKLLAQEGISSHENISFLPLPRFFADRALARAVERIVSEDAVAMMITADESIPFSSLKSSSFAEFTARVMRRTESFYQGGVHA